MGTSRRPLKKGGLMGNGKWEMAKCIEFSHVPSPIQDAFSILLASENRRGEVIRKVIKVKK
jgi:hypothetical protein